MEYLLIAGVAFWLGMKVDAALNVIAFRKVLEELGVNQNQLRELARREGIKLTDEDPESELPTLEIRIEQMEGSLYAYRLDNDQFLAQGLTQELLLESLTKNLNNVRIIVSDENGANFVR